MRNNTEQDFGGTVDVNGHEEQEEAERGREEEFYERDTAMRFSRRRAFVASQCRHSRQSLASSSG